MESKHNKPRMTIPMMMQKLDDMYGRQEEILDAVKKLQLEYVQIGEDADLLQVMIMHQSNKKRREATHGNRR